MKENEEAMGKYDKRIGEKKEGKKVWEEKIRRVFK